MEKVGPEYDDTYTDADAHDIIVAHVGYFMHVNACLSAVILDYYFSY